MTDPLFTERKLLLKGVSSKRGFACHLWGFPPSPLTCEPWIVKRDFCFSFFKFLFDPHVQGNKNWACGAEAKAPNFWLCWNFIRNPEVCLCPERGHRNGPQMWEALEIKVLSQSSRDPTNASRCSFFTQPTPKERCQLTPSFPGSLELKGQVWRWSKVSRVTVLVSGTAMIPSWDCLTPKLISFLSTEQYCHPFTPQTLLPAACCGIRRLGWLFWKDICTRILPPQVRCS